MVLGGENQNLEWDTQRPWERIVGGGHRDAKGVYNVVFYEGAMDTPVIYPQETFNAVGYGVEFIWGDVPKG